MGSSPIFIARSATRALASALSPTSGLYTGPPVAAGSIASPAPPFLVPARQESAKPQHSQLPARDGPLDLQRLMVRAEFIGALLSKRVVLAGTFLKLMKKYALRMAERLGGN